MKSELHILIADPNPTDATQVVRKLHDAGVRFAATRVDTREALLEQLKAFSPDLILSECQIPEFDVREILELAQAHAPVIICTSSVNEAAAAECLSAGAADYVIKEHLARLGPALSGVLAPRRSVEQEQEAAHARHAAAQRWQATFDAMRDAICLVDQEGRILQCNRAMQDFIGKACQDVAGLHCWQVLHGSAEPPSGCAWPRLRESKKRESEVLEQDGRWLNVTVDPLLDEAGNLAGAVHIMADVTKRRQAEVTMSTHLRLLETLLDTIPSPVFYKNTKGVYQGCNTAFADQVIGLPKEQIIGRSLHDLPEAIPHDLADLYQRQDAELLRNLRPRFYEAQAQCADGERHDFLISKAAFNDASGNVAGIIGVMVDITQRKKLEEQLRHATKMETVGQLAGGIAHDFNNILTGIKGYAEFLVQDTQDDPAKNQDAREVLRLSDSAAALTRQLLAFSRKQTLRPQVLELNKLIENTTRTLKRLIGENIELQFSPGEDLGRVQADPGQIEQVLMNLAVNARDAMPNGGELTIETANVELNEDYAATHFEAIPGPHVMFAVTDTGCGMDRATLDRVFEPFFTTKERGKGTGLGLATVYGIVKQHGGNIWVYSEPGRGTTFKVYLPRIDEPASQTAPAARRTAAPGGSETILVVEDDASVRTVVQRTLQARGYNVLSATNAQEAKSIMSGQGHAVRLLLTDVVMPGASGPELYEQLRAAHPALRVAYMSGYATDAIGRHGLLAADVPFISKPFTPDSLAIAVRKALDG